MVGPDFKSGCGAVRAVLGVFDSHTSPPHISAGFPAEIMLCILIIIIEKREGKS